MTLDVVELLRQLVRIPSVNPMGRDGTDYGERALTDFLQQFFEQLHVPWERHCVAPQRDNIVARLDRSSSPHGDEDVLVFEVHQDTVPVDGMTIAPWEPTIRDGRVYGRGSCDDKGGMACMLAAFARLARDRPPDMRTIIMACTVNEEYGFTGATEMARSWNDGLSPLVPRKPDAVIVAEPTSLDVVVAHKGVVRWRCNALGRAAHSACPDNGDNAIYHMGHALVGLQQYATELAQTATHPRVGSPTISVGTIQGGICVNAVPDLCSIEIDRRLLPDEDPDAAMQTVVDWLAHHTPASDHLRHDPPFLASPGLIDQAETPLARRLCNTVQSHGCPGRLIGVPFGTDAPAFAALGIPAVVFGPGSIQQAHTADEWVPIDQLHTASNIYFEMGKGSERAS